MMAHKWRWIPLLIFATLSLFLWRGLQLDPQKIPLAQINHPLPNFNLSVLGEKTISLSNKTFIGQVSLFNVWASWCRACVEEQSFLLKLKAEGIKLYGLNYKDDANQAQQWLIQWGNPYQLIGQDSHGLTAIDLGVYGAPETFLIDKQGVIRYRHVGVLDQRSWDTIVHPLYRYFEEH